MNVLSTLRNGMSALRAQVQPQIDDISTRRSSGFLISQADDDWLDFEANLTDELHVLESVEASANVPTTLESLRASGFATAIDRLLTAGSIDITPPGPPTKGTSPAVLSSPSSIPQSINGEDDDLFDITHSIPVKKIKKIHYKLLTKSERLDILDWMKTHPHVSQSHAARFWTAKIGREGINIDQKNISRWKKFEDQWRKEIDSDPANATRKKKAAVEHPQVRQVLDLWISQALRKNMIITGPILVEKYRSLASARGIVGTDLKGGSNGWLDGVKARHNLSIHVHHGEAASAHPTAVQAERERIQKILVNWDLRNVYNEDETGLFYERVPNRGLNNTMVSGQKRSKKRLTVHFAVNATGSDFRIPLIIGKAHRPRCFDRKTGTELGFYYKSNKRAWMTSELYCEYITRWDRELALQSPPRKILLLQDNFAGHIVPNNLTCITVVKFAPNLTSHIQPLDQGIIANFKRHYQSLFLSRAIERDDTGVPPADIYKINQLDGMKLARRAWREISPSTIAKCWRKSGILPLDSIPDPSNPSITIQSLLTHLDTASNIDDHMENHLQDDLSTLQNRNRLSKTITINQLLNIDDEDDTEEYTDSQLWDIVEDDDDVDDIIPVEETTPAPTIHDARSAATLLSRFVPLLESPALEEELDSVLSRVLRAIRVKEDASYTKQTEISSYFQL